MAEQIPDSVIGFIVENLRELIHYKSELKISEKLNKNFINLADDLDSLNAFFKMYTRIDKDNNDIPRQQLAADDARKLACQAEYAIEEYIGHMTLHSTRTRLQKTFHLLSHPLKLRNLGKQIEKVSRNVNYRLEALKINVDAANKAKNKASVVEEDSVVGFEDEAKTIIELLIGDSEQLEIVSIIGILGLGKTSLARKVLNDPKVQYEFLPCVFVNVSQGYDRREVFISILSKLIQITPDIIVMPENEIVEKLREELGTRKYLIVLDDMWTPDAWKDLEVAFPNNKKGSRVLITSRHNLRFMTCDESQELLWRKVSGENVCPPQHQGYELRILKKCDGLPLAIVVVAGTLLNQQAVDEIQSCKLDLRFLRMLFWSLLTLEDTDAEIRLILNHPHEDKWGISRNELVAPSRLEDAKLECGEWILDLQGRMQHCKQQFEESCELLLQCSLRCNSSKKKLTLKFLDVILENLKDLYKCKTDDEIVLLKNQIATLEKKLRLLQNLYSLTPKQWRRFEEIREFKVFVHAFAHFSTSLVFLYWMKSVDEEMASRLNLLLYNVLQTINPCDPVFKAFYIRFLKEIKLRQLDSVLLGQIIQVFLDLLLENLVDILKDDFQKFQESLMFVISFLANPHDQHAEDEEQMMVTAEIEVLVKHDMFLVLSVYDLKENFPKSNTRLSDFMRKVELVKGKIQQVYDQIRDSFSYDFPRTNGLGFFNFLLQNLRFLKEKLKRDTDFIPFAKHLIIEIEDELMSLRPYLNDLFEQQKEHKELRETWLKVINLAYQTEYAINSCSVINHPLWYNMASLMRVLDEIKVVKSKLKNIEGTTTHDGGVLHCSAVALNKVLQDPWASGFNQVMVDLKGEVTIIVGNLIRGSSFLDIVAIVGMAGLGKTTMANKVYGDPAVRQHFHVFAYCVVSQVHNARKMLLDILCDINEKDDKMYDMVEDDLADMLRKCLKRRRYLIIMDDIWDVKAWDDVKRSLPDDQNGSRVIFTTRIHNVALQAKNDCIIHPLRFLSKEESWELLRRKTFRAKACPADFSKVGKMIAKNCNGLPLTVVLIGGLLARTERSLRWWNKISKIIGSYVSTEGGMDVLELSYQHLPEHLKSCFLYFGAFAEDTIIDVNKLTLLWIGEGFVQNFNREDIKNVAKEYLSDLVDRSLVIANERSSYGGIKNCRMHDLVHEFCQRKSQEENFFQLMGTYEASNSSSSIVRNPYRACIHKNGKYFSDATETCPSIHSLLDSRKREFIGHDRPYVSKLKLVQVMDLEDSKWDTSFFREIAPLVHLRFIATSLTLKSRTIVPSYISNLWNLEILILTVTRGGLKLPETVWNMTCLRHVDVGNCYISKSGVKKRESYPHPQMINLESFSSPKIFSTEDLEDLLQRSPSLRKLSFENYIDRHSFHFPKLDSVSKLESLKVSYVGETCLRSFNFLSSLKKLSLSYCYINWRYLPVISKIPCLEVLKLLHNSFVGLKLDIEDTEFPKLKFLKLQKLRLAEWIENGESFPSLEVLIVDKCYYLNTIPPCFGEMPTLNRIEVYESPKVTASVAQIRKAQKEFGNEEFQAFVSRRPFRK